MVFFASAEVILTGQQFNMNAISESNYFKRGESLTSVERLTTSGAKISRYWAMRTVGQEWQAYRRFKSEKMSKLGSWQCQVVSFVSSEC